MTSNNDNNGTVSIDCMNDPEIAGARAELYEVGVAKGALPKEETLISTLNEDVFYKICTYLDLDSIVSLARSCETIRSRLQCYLKHYKDIKRQTLCGVSHKIDFLKLVGKYVENYEGNINVKYLSNLCPNLQRLNATNLYCMTDIGILGTLINLKHLNIFLPGNVKSAKSFGEVLNRLSSLEKLKFTFIYKRDNFNPFEMIKSNMPNLRQLNILEQWISEEKLKTIIEKCPQLERLAYSGPFSKCLFELNKLQHLHADNQHLTIDDDYGIDCFRLLNVKCGSKLQSLILPHVTPSNEMWKLIGRLSCLRELKVEEIQKSSLIYVLQLTKLESMHFVRHDFREEQWSQMFRVCSRLNTLYFSDADKKLLESLRVATKYRKKLRIIIDNMAFDTGSHDENVYDYIEELIKIDELNHFVPLLMNEEPV